MIVGAVCCSYYDDLQQTGITYFIGQKYRRNGYAVESVQAYINYFLYIIKLRNLLQQLGKIMSHHGKPLKRFLFNWLKEKCIKILTMQKKNCIVFMKLQHKYNF